MEDDFLFLKKEDEFNNFFKDIVSNEGQPQQK